MLHTKLHPLNTGRKEKTIFFPFSNDVIISDDVSNYETKDLIGFDGSNNLIFSFASMQHTTKFSFWILGHFIQKPFPMTSPNDHKVTKGFQIGSFLLPIFSFVLSIIDLFIRNTATRMPLATLV